jgi:hypothetical protein
MCPPDEGEKALTYYGINGIEGAKKYNIIGIYFGKLRSHSVVRMIFKKDVLSIVPMIKKSQRNRAFGIGMYAHVLTIHVVLLQEVYNDIAYVIITRFRDEARWHPYAS